MSRFVHSVASGDPGSDRVVLWTRVTTPRTRVEVEWLIAHDPELGDVAQRGVGWAEATSDHTIAVDVVGLEPAHVYWYAFVAEGERSPIGRTRTMPNGHVARLRVGFVSCARYATGFFAAYRHLAEQDVDVVVHLGDHIYEDDGGDARTGRVHEPPDRCVTLSDYRTRHAQWRRDLDLRRLCERHPVVSIWDDHDLSQNAWRHGSADHRPDLDGPWERRRAAAIQAWREWVPVRSMPGRASDQIYRRFTIGDLAELILLDARVVARDAPQAEEGVVLGTDHVARSILGDEQWAWLAGEVSSIASAWCLVASSVVVAPMHAAPIPKWLGPLGSRLGAVGGGIGLNADQWDGFPQERTRLLQLMAGRSEGDLVLVSGDIHSSWAMNVPADGGAPAGIQLVVPAVAAPSFAETSLPPTRPLRHLAQSLIRRANPHVRWSELESHGYAVVDVTPDELTAQWWHVDSQHPAGGERCAATFVVRRHDPTLRAP